MPIIHQYPACPVVDPEVLRGEHRRGLTPLVAARVRLGIKIHFITINDKKEQGSSSEVTTFSSNPLFLAVA